MKIEISTSAAWKAWNNIDNEINDKSPKKGDSVTVKNRQGVGKIHNIKSRAGVQVLMPNDGNCEVPMTALQSSTKRFSQTMTR